MTIGEAVLCGDKPRGSHGGSMLKQSTVLIFAIFSIVATNSANAQQAPKHQIIVCNERGCSDRPTVASATHTHAAATQIADANGNDGVVGRRPSGCPHAFCGCEASRYLFGEIRPELNLAANWIRKFPRTSPAPGMVAARQHHVMVLMRHVEGNDWFVHDGNSGGGLTREHIVSISGYTVVNPRVTLTASTR
jgi:hypothetical protein